MSIVKNLKENNSLEINFSDFPKINEVAFIKDEIAFILSDGRVIYIPLEWSKKLSNATVVQRKNYINNGYHIFWDDIDEIIGVKNILFGKKLFL